LNAGVDLSKSQSRGMGHGRFLKVYVN